MLGIFKSQFGKIGPLFVCILFVLVPAYYAHFILENAVNAPCWDDYDSLVQFTNLFLDADSIKGKVGHILSQHNEHRIAFLRLVALSVFTIKGDLDFRWLNYIGNAALLIMAYFLFRAFKIKGKYKALYFAPVLFLLFQPQFYDSLLCPTVQLTHFYALLFALITLLLLEKKGRISFSIACIFAVFAVFSQGNGVLIAPVGLALLLFKRDYKRAGLWLLFSLAVLSVYFIGYGRIPGDSSHLGVLIQIKNAILYLFCFAGMAAGFSSYYPSLFVGIGIALYFIFLTVSKYFKSNPPIYFLALFIFLTMALNAVVRSGKGVDFVFDQPRYNFTSVCLMILVYLSFCEIVMRKGLGMYVAIPGLLSASLFFFASVRWNSPKVVEISETLRCGLVKWYVDGSGLLYPFSVKANRILNEAIKKSVYRYPSHILEEFMHRPYVFSKEVVLSNLEYVIDTVVENDKYIYIDGWALVSRHQTRKQRTLIILKSSKQTFFVRTAPVRRPDLAILFQSRGVKESGFGSLFSKSMIPPGRYQIGIYVESGEKRGLAFSDKYVEIKKE